MEGGHQYATDGHLCIRMVAFMRVATATWFLLQFGPLFIDPA